MKTVKQLTDLDHVDSQFLVTVCNKCLSGNGKPYLNMTLQDATGNIDARKWDLEPGDEELFVAGNVVSIVGDVNNYRGQLQMKIVRGYPLPQDTIDYSRFVQNAPLPKDEMEKTLTKYVNEIADPEISLITKTVLRKYYKDYVVYPAAVRNHHACVSGLLYHSLSMATLAYKVCEVYPSLNRDILVAGTLMHDIGKVTELSGPIATKYTVEGKLLGHINIFMADLRAICKDLVEKSQLSKDSEIPLLLEHMILSHHTKPEFGSPVPPLTKEAMVLGMIDDLDAKLNVLDKAYEGVEKGEFTARIFPMDDHYFYKPFYTKD